MASVDVTVRGGGIFGLSCAWELARRGARVRLIERERIGAGSSGGLVGALSPHIPEQWNPKKQFQLDSLLMAESFWAVAKGNITVLDDLAGWWALIRDGAEPLVDEADRDFVAQALAMSGYVLRLPTIEAARPPDAPDREIDNVLAFRRRAS